MTTIDQLASNIKAIALNELRPELRAMRSDEALLIHLEGKAFVVIAADAWSDLVETVSGRDDAPMVPDEF
jgi:hypothetical protein